ncbi:uncharacterized protein LOC114465503 [Gouania willdenowi]|uniref:uncharacterized protein LOC114465503 n=1 Tax=Gouania willdenowi TaxID=441366 RepID=UPI0010569148|nr:uncharacterized protein LOC114465503 [Gouania willdenowi]
MEQEVVAGLSQALGKSSGAEFSPEDVSVLYRKVFHISSSSGEARAAIKKITGCDRWSCVGEKVLDVLVEMEREREKKEMLFWDLQLLNARSLRHHVMNYLHKNAKITPSFGSASSQLFSGEINSFQFCEKRTNTRKIKKAAKLRWARLASEGVRSLLSRCCQTSYVTNPTWGWVSVSDLLLLLEVKYDVVTNFLYTEMLQEHHTKEVWDTLLPWQQDQEMEMLEELVEEALLALDMLKMAELPGAFRIYRFPGLENPSWSAVSFLIDLHEFRQRERHTLTALSQKLHKDSLKLLGLNIWLATLRAQRERNSFRAFMSAQQSWETWPNVNNPCKAERVALLLYSSKAEEKRDLSETLQQSTVLELLVLTQQQEMNQLVELVLNVSQGASQDADDESDEQRTLRSGCLRTLEQNHAQQQQEFLQTNPPAGSEPQQQVKRCARHLISNLMDRHEVQASDLLQALADTDGRCVRSLRDRYVSEIQAQNFTNLQQLLLSDTNSSKNSDEQTGAHLSHKRQDTDESQSIRGETTEAQRAKCKLDEVTQRKDICSGCGAVMEDLPYLETGFESREGEDDPTKISNYDKQESLIALAWSKPPAEDFVNDEEVQMATDKRADVQSQAKTQIQPTQTGPGTSRDQVDVSLVPRQQLIKEDQQHQWEASPERDFQTESLRRIHPHLLAEIPESDPNVDSLCRGKAVNVVREVCMEEVLPSEAESELWDLKEPRVTQTVDRSVWETETLRESSLTQRERVRESVSAVERETTMRSLVDMQRRFEQKQQRDRDRQLLRVQERLSIIQNKKAEKDLLGLKHTDRLKHLTHDLPMEDRNQQKSIVRERLEKLRRERSTIMQSKRDRNTTGFKELLSPAVLQSSETEDGADWDTPV